MLTENYAEAQNRFWTFEPIQNQKTGAKIMGPYSRGTTHGIGAVIEMLYEYPILMLLVVAVVATGLFVWYRKQSAK